MTGQGGGMGSDVLSDDGTHQGERIATSVTPASGLLAMTGRGGGMGRGALCDNGSNMSLRGIPVSAGMTWQSGSPGGEDTLKGKAMSPLLAAGYCPKSQGRFSVSLTQRTVPVILEGESGGTCPRVTHTLTLHWVPVRGSSVRAGGDLIRHGFAVPPFPKGEGYTAPTGCDSKGRDGTLRGRAPHRRPYWLRPKREGRHSVR